MTRAIIIAIIAVAVALLLLCVRILLKKGGKFSSEHISANKRMRQDGIHCATSQDREARRNAKKKLDINQL
jgi:hypothetical protein